MNATQTTVRPVAPADKAAIAQLWQALTDYHVALDPRLPAATPGAAERYADRLVERRDDPMTCVYVAEIDGQVIGYILGAIIDLYADLFEHSNVGFIADVFVEPAFRRQGIARQLVDRVNAWLVEQGIRHTEWQVAAANTGGIRFWEAVGGLATMVRMQMPLAPSEE
ncbi:MAG: GNAT family N-acetyltransferase [Chloroflexi bacterium]|nr:GNAT family N-acetyltransferase [Chloroflexota bacterium]